MKPTTAPLTWTAESEAEAWRRIASETRSAAPVEPVEESGAPEPETAPAELWTRSEQAAQFLTGLEGFAAREALRIPNDGAAQELKTHREAVNHPSHYHAASGLEVIDVIEAWALNFNRGNALKYLARAGHKDPSTERQDLEKALWYIERELERLGSER